MFRDALKCSEMFKSIPDCSELLQNETKMEHKQNVLNVWARVQAQGSGPKMAATKYKYVLFMCRAGFIWEQSGTIWNSLESKYQIIPPFFQEISPQQLTSFSSLMCMSDTYTIRIPSVIFKRQK